VKPYPVEIEWTDSTFLHGWKKVRDFQDLRPDVCRSVGYLVSRTVEAVTIVQSMGGDEYGDGITIPTKTIRRIRRLQVR
jgi:hypothetical protein